MFLATSISCKERSLLTDSLLDRSLVPSWLRFCDEERERTSDDATTGIPEAPAAVPAATTAAMERGAAAAAADEDAADEDAVDAGVDDAVAAGVRKGVTSS